jgi:hypothetical protein
VTAATCLIGSKAHGAEVGYLCSDHLERLASMLREIEDEAALLSAVPSMQQASGSRGGSLASHRSPARLDVVVANDPRRGDKALADAWGSDDTLSILDCLGGWARLVREERQLSTPPEAATVVGEREVLSRNLSWIAEQAWCDEFHDEVKALLGQLKRANGTRADKPFCRCPMTLTNGALCTGSVWIHDETQLVWRRYPDRCARDWEKAPGAAKCDACATVWASEADKARLEKMVDDVKKENARPLTWDGRKMYTAQEIADRSGKKLPAIRMQLSRLGVKAQHGSYYDPDMLTETAQAS